VKFRISKDEAIKIIPETETTSGDSSRWINQLKMARETGGTKPIAELAHGKPEERNLSQNWLTVNKMDKTVFRKGSRGIK
jgi:hypothetical protein